MDIEYNSTRHEPLTYFLECSEAEAVKIGRTNNIKWRVSILQGGCPYPLRVVVATTIPESELHRRFAAWRIQGEWFRLTSEIHDFIKQCALSDPLLPHQGQHRM